MNKAELARKMVEKYPTLSKKELGKRLAKEYPTEFKDGEHARDFIRGVTGGNSSQRSKQTDKYIGPRLEPGDKFDNSPFILSAKKIGLIYDVHIPFHDRDALYMALSWLKAQDIDCLVLGGDIIDCYSLSRFEKDINHRSFWDEIKMLTDFLDDLRDNFPDQGIIYRLGNHDHRFKRYLLQQARELSTPITTIDYLIKQKIEKCTHEKCDLDCPDCGGLKWIVTNKDRGVKVVGDRRPIHAGKLDIIHGHETMASNPVSPARGFMLKRKVSTIGGHFHRSSKQTSKDARGSVQGSWSVGCLCDLTPQYMPENEWSHGFAMVEIEGDMFTVHNKEIINGRVV
jgi:predicted phosphodiesterase